MKKHHPVDGLWFFSLNPHFLPGKGLKHPKDSGPQGETCDCLGDNDEFEVEGRGNRKGLRKSVDEDLDKKDPGEEEDKKDSGEEEERKESFEPVQFKSNQKKGKGLPILLSSLKQYIALPIRLVISKCIKMCSRQSLVIFFLS